MPDLNIRRAVPTDAAALLAIYAPIVEDTAISFEATVPSEADFAARIAKINKTHLWLVAEYGGGVAGYAYAGPHRSRAAYGYSVDTTVYLDPAYRGKGIGAALYERLFDELVQFDYYNAFAGITLPNDASIALHKKAGFEFVGAFEDVGFKRGTWRDVSWWRRQIKPGQPSG